MSLNTYLKAVYGGSTNTKSYGWRVLAMGLVGLVLGRMYGKIAIDE
jgi:hypothetical protein